jgi:hypothetical protein
MRGLFAIEADRCRNPADPLQQLKYVGYGIGLFVKPAYTLSLPIYSGLASSGLGCLVYLSCDLNWALA